MNAYPVGISADLNSDHLGVVFEQQKSMRFPHTTTCRLKRVWDFNEFVHAGWTPIATSEHPMGVDAVLVQDRRALYLDYRPNELRMRIAGLTRLDAKSTKKKFLKLFGEPEADEPSSSVPFLAWTGGAHHARLQHVDPPDWSVARHNYPELVAEQLDELSAMGPPEAGEGSLCILAGAPGTGKSSFVRTLMRSWSDWAEFSVLYDPEEVFGSSSAILDLADAPPIRGKRRGYRVLLIEDLPPEILSGKAWASGPLSRLLGLSDGLLADGMRLVILLTTNSEARDMAPALLRPGRLRKMVTFKPFLATEAAAWLEMDVPSGNFTLADLFEAERLGHLPEHAVEAPTVGVYL